MYSATKDEMHKDQAARDMRNGARRVKHDVEDAAENLKEDLSHLAQDVARKAGEHMRHMADSATDTVAEAKETMTERITDSPLQAVAIAAGVGFVLGMLFRR